MENTREEKQLSERAEFYKEVDENVVNPDVSTEKINTPSIKSKVNLEKDITLNVQITENVDDGSQQSVEII